MTQALRSKLGCFQGAVSVVMSKRWSCDTLRVGFGEVMDDAMADEESKLLKEIEDCLPNNHSSIPLPSLAGNRSSTWAGVSVCQGLMSFCFD